MLYNVLQCEVQMHTFKKLISIQENVKNYMPMGLENFSVTFFACFKQTFFLYFFAVYKTLFSHY